MSFGSFSLLPWPNQTPHHAVCTDGKHSLKSLAKPGCFPCAHILLSSWWLPLKSSILYSFQKVWEGEDLHNFPFKPVKSFTHRPEPEVQHIQYMKKLSSVQSVLCFICPVVLLFPDSVQKPRDYLSTEESQGTFKNWTSVQNQEKKSKSWDSEEIYCTVFRDGEIFHNSTAA